MVYYTRHDSPVGTLLLTGDREALAGVYFPGSPQRDGPDADWQPAEHPFDDVRRQLDAYFAGQLQQFDLPLAPEGTAFQKQVWGQLSRIPFGQTISYGELARRIGNPKASRAVGAANGQNPISIIVPCHRVIGADGTLTGFGGGLTTKQALLDHEQRHAGLFASAG